MKFKPQHTNRPSLSLRLVFTMKKKQQRWSTGVSVPASLWHDKAQQLGYDQKQLKKAGWTVAEVNQTNKRLSELRSKLEELVNEQKANDVFDDSHIRQNWEAFRDGKAELSAKSYSQKTASLESALELCVVHKKRYPQANTRGGKTISKATENNFNQARSSVAAFDKHSGNTTTLQNCDLSWCASYLEFLTDVLCLTGETPAKGITTA